MQPKKEQLSHLLDKYLQGKADAEEIALLHKWFLQLNLSEQEIFRSFSEEEIRLKMRQHIFAQIRPVPLVQKLNPSPIWLCAVAASIVFLLSVFLSYQYFKNSASVSFATTAIVADGNSKKQITLPDSSRVTLNLLARLEYDESFNSKERRVSLVGEAFFDVKKDSLKPFIIKTNNLETRVLGTAFNIESYEGEQQIRVALLRGKVSVQDQNALSSELYPGQMLVYNRSVGTVSIQPVTARHIGAWQEHKIIFNDVPLQDAISRLRLYHKLKIAIDPTVSFAGMHVTGEYESNNAQQILQAILLVHDLTIKRNGETLYVTQKN